MTDPTFEEIYRVNFGPLYRCARALTGSEQEAAELTSETFFKALCAIDGFRGACSVSTWLCQIAKNTFYSRQRQARRLASDDALFEQEDRTTPAPGDRLADAESAAEIAEALHHLKEPYQEVFCLRVFGELDFQEIGRRLGRTGNWACVTYHRARKMIQSQIEEESI